MKILTMKSGSKGHVALLFANVIFGLNTPISKGILAGGEVSPFALSMYRMCGATVLFWIASMFFKRERVPLKDIGLLALAGMFGIVLNQQTFLVGLSLTSPVDASIVITLLPVIVMVISAIYLKEPITWKKALGVGIGATGVLMLILTSSGTTQAASSMKGNLLILCSVCFYSIYLTMFKPVIMKYHPVTLMKWMFLFALVVTMPINLPDAMAVDYNALSNSTLLSIIYVVVMATFCTYLLIPIGQKNLRPTIVGMYNYIQPVVTYAAAVIIGMDTFGWRKTCAALLVFFGVYVVNKSKSRAQIEAARKKMAE